LLRRLSQNREMYCDKSDDRIDIEKLIADTFEGGDKLFLQMKAMQKGMHGRFDRVEERFDALENHLGEFKFLIENFNDDYKEATASIIQDFKSLTEQEIGTTVENQ